MTTFRQKRQKRHFPEKLWGLGRLFYRKVQFWAVRKWCLKVVSKSGGFEQSGIEGRWLYPKEAWWTARVWWVSRECISMGGCGVGGYPVYGGTGTWSIPSAHPWYGSGPSYPHCFPTVASLGTTVASLWPHCGLILAEFGSILPHFVWIWPHFGWIWPHFGPVFAEFGLISDPFLLNFRHFRVFLKMGKLTIFRVFLKMGKLTLFHDFLLVFWLKTLSKPRGSSISD